MPSQTLTTPCLHHGYILSVSSLRNGDVCSSSDDATISIYNWRNNDHRVLRGHKKAVSRVISTKDSVSQKIWSASRDLSIKQWDHDSGKCVQTINDAHTLNIAGIALNSDGERLGSGSRDYSVKVWDVNTGKVAAEYSAPRNIVTCLVWSEGSNCHLFQGAEDLCVRGWDTRQSSKVPAEHLTGFQYFPSCLAQSNCGNLLAAGCKGFNGVGCDIKVWDIRCVRTGKFLREFSGHQQDVTGCKFISVRDIPGIVSVSRDCSVRTWPVFPDSNPVRQLSFQSHALPDQSSLTCVDTMSADNILNDDSRSAAMICVGDMDGSVSVINFELHSDELICSLRAKSLPSVSDQNEE
mmetsp:Transcript_11837/g.17914  ORF Transcript_11837/g.17914 Transcript_11837/m.17914 type:complete len:351 (+) Transcript_11837:91-1143(+)